MEVGFGEHGEEHMPPVAMETGNKGRPSDFWLGARGDDGVHTLRNYLVCLGCAHTAIELLLIIITTRCLPLWHLFKFKEKLAKPQNLWLRVFLFFFPPPFELLYPSLHLHQSCSLNTTVNHCALPPSLD